MRFSKWIGALIVATALSAASAQADFIAGNFGPGDSYQTGTGNSWGTGYPSYPASSEYASNAVAFTNSTSTTYALDQFRFAANYFAGDNTLLVDFYGGSSDLNSASLLESFTFTAPTQFDDYIYTATSIVHPLLLPGETYFIVLSTPQTVGTIWGWQWNDQGQNGFLTRFDSNPWFEQTDTAVVFDVSGSVPVPEPSTMLLATLGLVSLGTIRVVQRARGRK